MLPTQDTDHVAEGLAWLIGQYRGKLNVTSLTTALLNRVQDAEDMLWDVINSQLTTRAFPAGTAQGQLSGPPDQALLFLADLAGCPVGTLTTSQLVFLLVIWRTARKSKGHADDLIRILAKGFGSGQYSYAEYFPADFQATVLNVPDAELLEPLVQALTIARAPGVYGVVGWGTWPTATLFFGDAVSGLTGSGFDDSVADGNAMGFLSAEEVA